MKLTPADLDQKVNGLLCERGFTAEDASTISKPILWAVLHGNNQGLLKFVGEPALKKDMTQRPISILKETACTAWFDGGERIAMIVVQTLVDKAKELLKKSGIVAVGNRGTRSSCGALAYFTEQLAHEGFIAVMLCRTPPTVAPFGAIEPLFGTNPISISFPSIGAPITFDMATAAIAWYGLIEAAAAGEEVDSTAVIDALGKPTSNPDVVLKDGMVLPFDRGHKGSGLGMAVELIGGPLLGGAFCQSEGEWGNMLLALDPDMFAGKGEFRKHCSALIERLKGAKTDNSAVRLPGERATAFYEEVKSSGSVEIPEFVTKKLGWN
ncbi:MAG: Ldh family oxidoreductase [Candidatus Obscuribacterales bacterium]